MKLFSFLMLVVIGASFSVTVKSATVTTTDLFWKPTTEVMELKRQLSISEVKVYKIKVGPLTDKRGENPANLIGENSEVKKQPKQVVTNSNISDFITRNFSSLLSDFGLQIVTESPDYTLEGDILEFFVMEDNVYKSRAKMNLVLKKAGNVIWRETIMGKNTRFGRSYKMENYMETLADSLIDMTYNLLDNADFTKSFQTKKNGQ